jgi:hypothetical protein
MVTRDYDGVLNGAGGFTGTLLGLLITTGFRMV